MSLLSRKKSSHISLDQDINSKRNNMGNMGLQTNKTQESLPQTQSTSRGMEEYQMQTTERTQFKDNQYNSYIQMVGNQKVKQNNYLLINHENENEDQEESSQYYSYNYKTELNSSKKKNQSQNHIISNNQQTFSPRKLNKNKTNIVPSLNLKQKGIIKTTKNLRKTSILSSDIDQDEQSNQKSRQSTRRSYNNLLQTQKYVEKIQKHVAIQKNILKQNYKEFQNNHPEIQITTFKSPVNRDYSPYQNDGLLNEKLQIITFSENPLIKNLEQQNQQIDLKNIITQEQSPQNAENIMKDFFPHYKNKDQQQEQQIDEKVKSRNQKRIENFNNAFRSMENRQNTFSKFGFKSHEQDDNIFLRPVIKEFTGSQAKGTMLVCDLWSDINQKQFLNMSQLVKDKITLQKIAQVKARQNIKKANGIKPVVLSRKEEKVLSHKMQMKDNLKQWEIKKTKELTSDNLLKQQSFNTQKSIENKYSDRNTRNVSKRVSQVKLLQDIYENSRQEDQQRKNNKISQPTQNLLNLIENMANKLGQEDQQQQENLTPQQIPSIQTIELNSQYYNNNSTNNYYNNKININNKESPMQKHKHPFFLKNNNSSSQNSINSLPKKQKSQPNLLQNTQNTNNYLKTPQQNQRHIVSSNSQRDYFQNNFDITEFQKSKSTDKHKNHNELSKIIQQTIQLNSENKKIYLDATHKIDKVQKAILEKKLYIPLIIKQTNQN